MTVEDSTGERRRMGSIGKQGSRLLRFLLVEAGQVARRHDQELDRVYRRLLLRRGHATCCEMRSITPSFNAVANGVDHDRAVGGEDALYRNPVGAIVQWPALPE